MEGLCVKYHKDKLGGGKLDGRAMCKLSKR